MVPFRQRPAIVLLAVLTLACGGGGSDGHLDTASAAASINGNSDPGERAVRVHAVLTGGQAPGSYDSTLPTGICQGGVPEMEAVGIGASLDSVPDQMFVHDASIAFDHPAAARGGTNDFRFAMVVSGPKGGDQIELAPKNGKGTGTATISGDFPVYKAHVQGTAANGTKLDVTLDCAS